MFCFEQTLAASNTGGSSERCAQRERASNKSTFGRVTGLSGEMLYEIETRVTVSGPLARRDYRGRSRRFPSPFPTPVT